MRDANPIRILRDYSKPSHEGYMNTIDKSSKSFRKFLIKNEEEIFTVRGDGVRIKPDGVKSPTMLYLMRRSLEVLWKFHWTTLGGQSNQLSHVSSPLLSKLGEY
ncbi:hypothetical protein Tco_1508178 [Tanacetum coccineum]